MAITTLSRDYNPWVQALPSFLQNMALQKMGQRFRGQMIKQEQELRVKERKENREIQLSDIKSNRGFATSERVAGQEYKTSERVAGKKPGAIIHLKLDNAKGEPIFVAVRQNADSTLTEIGRGKRFKPGSTTVNVDTMSKRTQGDLEADIVMGGDVLARLDRVDEMFDDKYLEYAGKGQAWLEDKASKAGFKTSKFLSKYTAWKSEVDSHTLLWRKYITGVAGGPKEMEAIERTTINTKYDSPVSFKAKSKQLRIINNALIKRSKDLLSNGFDLNKMTPEARAVVAAQFPMENYGYQEIEIPKGRSLEGPYNQGKIYEDAIGNPMRFHGYNKNGKPIWGKP